MEGLPSTEIQGVWSGPLSVYKESTICPLYSDGYRFSEEGAEESRMVQESSERFRRLQEGFKRVSWFERVQDGAEERRRMQDGAGGAGVCRRLLENAGG